jgi:hypothetical protein
MFEKAFQVCPVNDKANVSRVVENTKLLHGTRFQMD